MPNADNIMTHTDEQDHSPAVPNLRRPPEKGRRSMRCQRVSYLMLSLSLAIPLLVASGSACSSTTPALMAQDLSTPYPTVTDQRLQRPEASDWLMYRRTYDNSGFSPLKQITSSNV